MRFSRLSICALALGACGGGEYSGAGDDSASLPDGGAGVPECFSSSECPVGWTCTELGYCMQPSGGDGGVPPAEVELEFGAPVSSQRYVWVAMTDQDAIAKIDGDTLAVTSIAVGERPEVLVALPNTDTAVVLDRINGAATVVRPTDESDLTEIEPTLPDLNQLAVSPSGRHAVAYFDLAKAIADAGSLDAVGSVGSFQDVTVIGVDASGTRTVDLTVGFRPREVEFDATGERAFVITDDGISVLYLDDVLDAGPTIVAPIPVTTDPFEDPSGLEVDVTSSGDLAIVREAGVAGLRVISLAGVTTGQLWEVPLAGPPSDLELSPDGDRAYAVRRTQQQLAVLDLPSDAWDPTGIELVDLSDATSGSLTLTSGGSRGILYTNATLDERLTVIDLDLPGFPHQTYPLQKGVRAVGVAPGGGKVLVIHAKAPGAPGDAITVDEFIDRSFGYSLVDATTGFAKLQITPVDPGAFTFADGAPRAYVLLDGGDAEGALAAVQELALDTGVVRTIELGSPPDAVGILPDRDQVFVSQRHPLGRVTFLEVTTGQVRTLTGFDLNSHVID